MGYPFVNSSGELKENPVSRILSLLLLACASLILIASVVNGINSLGGPFDSWVSADFATMARSFWLIEQFPQNLVPVNNNPPWGSDPGPYTHWPPLFPIVSSLLVPRYGPAEAPLRLFAVILSLACALLTAAIAWRSFGRIAGPVALIVTLTSNAVLRNATLVLHLKLAIVFMLASILLLTFWLRQPDPKQKRRCLAAAALCVSLGAASSWETAFVLPAIGVCAFFHPELRTAFLVLSAAVILTFAAVVFLYAYAYPSLVNDLVQVMSYRMGFTTIYAGDMLHVNSFAAKAHLSRFWIHHTQQYLLREAVGDPVALVGLLYLCVFAFLGFRKRLPFEQTVVIATILSQAVLWYIIFPNHAAIHPYQTLIFIPYFAIAAGSAADFIAARIGDSRWMIPTACLVVTGLVVARSGALATQTREAIKHVSQPSNDNLYRFGLRIKEATPQAAVILTPEDSMVPVYYSERHVIRCVTPETLMKKIQRAREVFPGFPLYVAFHGSQASEFQHVLPSAPPAPVDGFMVQRVP